MLRALSLTAVLLCTSVLGASAESPLDLLLKKQRQEAVVQVTASIVPAASSTKISKPKPRIIPRGNPTDALIIPAPPELAPKTIAFYSPHPTGTLVIDTSRRALYRVLSATTATRYIVAVGKEGFEWSGTELITSRTKWPDWRPPPEMRKRDPRLPEFVGGGRSNPLGSRALYLGNTLYRIHGTWKVHELGKNASSGCIRMHNEQVAALYDLVTPGATRVIVSAGLSRDYFGEGRGDTRLVSSGEKLPILFRLRLIHSQCPRLSLSGGDKATPQSADARVRCVMPRRWKHACRSGKWLPLSLSRCKDVPALPSGRDTPSFI